MISNNLIFVLEAFCLTLSKGFVGLPVYSISYHWSCHLQQWQGFWDGRQDTSDSCLILLLCQVYLLWYLSDLGSMCTMQYDVCTSLHAQAAQTFLGVKVNWQIKTEYNNVTINTVIEIHIFMNKTDDAIDIVHSLSAILTHLQQKCIDCHIIQHCSI